MVLTVLVMIFYIVALVSLALDGLWAVFLLLGAFYLCVVLWFITFGRIYIRRAKRRGGECYTICHARGIANSNIVSYYL